MKTLLGMSIITAAILLMIAKSNDDMCGVIAAGSMFIGTTILWAGGE